MLWEETDVPKVMSSNPGTIYWIDIFSKLLVVKIVMCVCEKTKIIQKEAGVGRPFKKIVQQSALVEQLKNPDDRFDN